MSRPIFRIALVALAAVTAITTVGAVGAEGPPVAPNAGAPPPFAPLDLPDSKLVEDRERATNEPWLVVVDDPQCPYCMQLHLAIVKARAAGAAELTRAVVVRVPYPLYIHDQAAHIVMDAYCLEAARGGRPGSAYTYLDWLFDGSWAEEPGWATATVADLEKADGLFETRFEAHRVSSSRIGDYIRGLVMAEVACAAPAAPGQPSPSCNGDAGCAPLCDKAIACRAACEAKGADAAASAASANATPATAEPAMKPPGECLAACGEGFFRARRRDLGKTQQACLLETGPDSAHAKAAALTAWARDHNVRGTPTVYVGHPRIGFRRLPDVDTYAELLTAFEQGLATVRDKLAGQP